MNSTFWTWAHECPYLATACITVVAGQLTSIIIGALETIEIVSRGYPPVTEVKNETKT